MGMASSMSLLPVPKVVLENLQSPEFRIPPLVLPTHYALEFLPDARQNRFVGSVYITMHVVEAPSLPFFHLVLHALDLRIEATSIRIFVPTISSNAFAASARQAHPSHHLGDEVSRRHPFTIEEGRYIPCQALETFDMSETVLLLFASPLPSDVGDNFALIIDCFEGVIATPPQMEGLFHSNSTDATVLSTHLEPTGARRLYPCFDEPAIQATFQLAIIAAAVDTVLSNTAVEADIPVRKLPYVMQRRLPTSADAGNLCFSAPESSTYVTLSLPHSAPQWHCVRFETTPHLHTCIVGFHIGRFTFLEKHSPSSGVLCRVVLPHTEVSSGGSFALDLAAKAVDFFSDFFNVQLPLKKLDLVCMETFCVLGMENWGMVNVLREYLIVTETTSLERRQRVTRLIGHEICHQWFGDWVSIEWWNGLWLKEGMCRYLEYFFVNAVSPGWGLWNEFLCNIMNGALLADADPLETHPVDCCNSAPRRIHDSFDAISYGKGACVLRMLFSIIGVEWLKRATHLLMVRFAGRAMNAKDLVNCIVDTTNGNCSEEVQRQHVKVLHACMHMVETVSHPYLYIYQRPGKSYTITQYVSPSKQHGLLVEYLRQQRRIADAPVINLFSAPSSASFEWTPEVTLRRVTAPFVMPLLTMEWTPSGGANVGILFVEEVEHHVDCPTSLPTFSAKRNPHHTPPVAVTGHARDEIGAVPKCVSSLNPGQTPPSPGLHGDLGGTRYFNLGGSGFFQCDYDASTWRRLFEQVAFFSEEDRLIITMHFIDFAKTELGHHPGESGDRCTLFFEWLMRLAATPGAMNSFLWEIVTNALTTLVQLTHHCYCHPTVKEFVNMLYRPLQQRQVLSFFAEDKTTSFQCSIHLTRHIVLRIVQLLCLCDNPAVGREAEEAAKWSLAALLPTRNKGSSSAAANVSIASVPADVGICSGTGVEAASPLSSQNPASNASGHLQSSSLVSTAGAFQLFGEPVEPTALMSKGLNQCSHRAVALPPPPMKVLSFSTTSVSERAESYSTPMGGRTKPSSAITTGLQKHLDQSSYDFNSEDPSHIQAGSIALSHLVTQGRLEYWVGVAAVAVELLRLDRDELRRVSDVPVPFPEVRNVSEEQRRSILGLVLPPVFALNKESAFPFMAKIFHAAPFLEASTVMALYRNSRFLLHMLSCQPLMTDRRAFEFLVRCGSEVCGNGYIIAQMKLLAYGGLSEHNASHTKSVEHYKDVEFADRVEPTTPFSTTRGTSQGSLLLSSTSASTVSERGALRRRSSAVAAALDSMESNCVWIGYCCSHFDLFLREQLHRKDLHLM
ncbi:puromycin-sensitive aminopeptidase-like protein [Leishmania tarentolae]|uniref:Puromycin-sensitive aminopeptidase-like protein n=1 Tax=Leishmania tarentolae TaxID=5689 RepID=A0A640KCH3_LEITA|nr:puromycin-sensitive aminopeptidase-like protein [Leishmania tarentolae]